MTLPHPAQANTGTEGWPNTTEWKNVSPGIPKISFEAVSLQRKWDLIHYLFWKRENSCSSMFSYTDFVQADGAREEYSEGVTQN